MRLVLALLFAVPLLSVLGPGEAEALSLDIVDLQQVGCTVDPVYSHCFGSVITIGMRVSNDSNTPILGMALAATGYDGFVASFQHGRAVDQVFAQICIPAAGCFNGLQNVHRLPLAERIDPQFGPEVLFMNGLSLTPIAYDGSVDPGLDGVIGGGGAQFELVFSVNGPGETTIDLGLSPIYGHPIYIAGGQAIYPIGFNKQIFVSSEEPAYVIPEPGVAYLLGLGLTGLAFGRSTRRLPADG